MIPTRSGWPEARATLTGNLPFARTPIDRGLGLKPKGAQAWVHSKHGCIAIVNYYANRPDAAIVAFGARDATRSAELSLQVHARRGPTRNRLPRVYGHGRGASRQSRGRVGSPAPRRVPAKACPQKSQRPEQSAPPPSFSVWEPPTRRRRLFAVRGKPDAFITLLRNAIAWRIGAD